jgi:hypothetical protein
MPDEISILLSPDGVGGIRISAGRFGAASLPEVLVRIWRAPILEIQQPMAVVILGGIVTSTFLNIIVIPALYLKYGEAVAAATAHDYPREGEIAPAGD